MIEFKFFRWEDIECQEGESGVDAAMRNIARLKREGFWYKERKLKNPADPAKLTVVSPDMKRWNIEDCIEALKGQWEFGNYRKFYALRAFELFNWLYYDFSGPDEEVILVSFDPYKLGLLDKD